VVGCWEVENLGFVVPLLIVLDLDCVVCSVGCYPLLIVLDNDGVVVLLLVLGLGCVVGCVVLVKVMTLECVVGRLVVLVYLDLLINVMLVSFHYNISYSFLFFLVLNT